MNRAASQAQGGRAGAQAIPRKALLSCSSCCAAGAASLRKLWAALVIVIAGSFAVLGWVGVRIYQEAPPIPQRVVTTTGEQVVGEFWNAVGAGLFGFMINPPIALYYMQGPILGIGAVAMFVFVVGLAAGFSFKTGEPVPTAPRPGPLTRNREV